MTKVLTIEKAKLKYQGRIIFENLSLSLHEKKWVGLLGQSGIGKTSLLRMIAGVATHEEKQCAEIKIHFHQHITQQMISYMPQQDMLLPWLTVIENTLLCAKLNRVSRAQKKHLQKKSQALLAQVGLATSANLYPHQLSGGMRQRVALVRTLLADQPIILMDEPFSALDAITRYKLQNLAATMLRDKTVLFITHDPSEALRLADDIYLLAGMPATLEKVTTLEDPKPRGITEMKYITLHTALLKKLTSECL